MLEHATFASPENEAHVVSLSVPSASPGSGRHGAGGSGGGDGSGAKGGGSGGSVSTDGGGLPFPQWLVGHLTRSAVCDAAAQPPPSPPAGPQVQAHPAQALFRVSHRAGHNAVLPLPALDANAWNSPLSERPLRCQHRRCQFVKCFPACCPKAWVQAGLSVLMNVTHNNEAGRDAVAANDGLEALVQLVSVFAAACMDKGERPRRLQVLRVLIAHKIRSDYQRRFHETYA